MSGEVLRNATPADPYTKWPIDYSGPGCGEIGPLGCGVCDMHVDRIDFDGFTIHWHCETRATARTLWRRAPDTRPTR